ncbi:MAG: tol-pal system protein YbgF, partial [Pseudomonadota bacterium]
SRLNGEIEELRHQLEQLKEQQREMYLDIERRLGGGAGEDESSSLSDQAENADEAIVESDPGVEAEAEAVPEVGQQEPAASSQASVAGPPQPGEQRQYTHAYDLLMQERDFQQAIAAFQQLLKEYPDGQYADNAQFWLGEAYYAKNELDDALEEFQNLVDRYAQSPKVPDAVYKVGYIHKIRGDVDKARMVFEGLIEHYPDSPAARLAAIRLETL